MIVSNEIQSLHDGRWRVDAVFESVDLAIGQATAFAQRPDSPPLRVVQEKFGGAGKSLLRVIYESSSVKSGNEAIEKALKEKILAEKALAVAELEPVDEERHAEKNSGIGSAFRGAAVYSAIALGLSLVGYTTFLATLILAG